MKVWIVLISGSIVYCALVSRSAIDPLGDVVAYSENIFMLKEDHFWNTAHYDDDFREEYSYEIRSA